MAVDIWTAVVDPRPSVIAALNCCLTDDERARTASFRFERDRIRHVFRRGMLRQILAHRLGVAPRDVAFATNAYGKPRLADLPHLRPVPFNLSHSADRVVVALGTAGDVGVDVEAVRALEDVDAIASDHFTAAERTYLATAGVQRDVAFLRLWTRKEAYVKAVGGGLSIPLHSFDVLSSDGIVGDGSGWWVADVALGSGYVGAVAVEGSAVDVRCVEWAPST